MQVRNEQEEFWRGAFGDQYTVRNNSDRLHISNLELFSRIVRRIPNIKSILEFGANRGLNLKALKSLLPDVDISAIEINLTAVQELKKLDWLRDLYHQSITDFTSQTTYDLCFVKGVLIHINPDDLSKVYDVLYKSSKKYVLIAEYYNPTPVDIEYRGHKNKLFKRDFCGEMLDKYTDLKLIDYGFCYHRDTYFPQDDITWFLLKKE